MDGARSWRILWDVLAPNLSGILASLAILIFISTWNDYFWPLLLTRSAENSVIQIGIRGAQNDTESWDYSLEHGMRVVFMEEFRRLGVEAVVAEARRMVGAGPTYVSFDVDGLDPVYAPGTGTPEIGGLSTFEAQELLRGLRGLDLVGGDVVEASPPFDPSGNTALVGATLMYELLCLLADAFVARAAGSP